MWLSGIICRDFFKLIASPKLASSILMVEIEKENAFIFTLRVGKFLGGQLSHWVAEIRYSQDEETLKSSVRHSPSRTPTTSTRSSDNGGQSDVQFARHSSIRRSTRKKKPPSMDDFVVLGERERAGVKHGNVANSSQ